MEPICLEAVFKAKRFIMIGDYKQLQPLVKSNEAKSLGMNKSLFENLCLKYPNNRSALTKQYRMNETIMSLSNSLVYEGKLKLGSYEQDKSRLSLSA